MSDLLTVAIRERQIATLDAEIAHVTAHLAALRTRRDQDAAMLASAAWDTCPGGTLTLRPDAWGQVAARCTCGWALTGRYAPDVERAAVLHQG